MTDSPPAEKAAATGSALAEQRNALAEARLRIIARYEHVETWLKQPAPEETLANWGGIVEGLRQARRIIGAMWDELPVPKPQAVIDHEEHMSRVMNVDSAFIAAAEGMDWQQVVFNGGPPCFRLESDGRFCGRAKSWHAHDTHSFVSFADLLRSNLQNDPDETPRETSHE